MSHRQLPRSLWAAAAASLLLATPLLSAPAVTELAWDRLVAEGRAHGTLVRRGGEAWLAVETAAAGTVNVLSLARPGTGPRYAFRGEALADGVPGTAFVELWSVFPGGGRYFTRTLGEGPMAPFRGTTPPRPLLVPFYGEAEPEALELNVVFDGPGRVLLGPLVLGPLEAPASAPELARWLNYGGAGLGVALGLLGALAGLGAARGSRTIRAIVTVGFLVGPLVAVALGVFLVAEGLPVRSVLPLGVAVVVPLALLPVVRARFTEAELRKMAARDAR